MSEANGPKISKRQNPFSQVANHPLRNPELSLKAKGLYAVIQSFINIPGFTLYKGTLMNVCSEGKDAFESAWKELKKSGYLRQQRISTGKGHFSYEYELLDFPEPNTENPVPENPDTVNPCVVYPYMENHVDNKKNEKNKNDLKNNDYSIFQHECQTNERKNELIPLSIEEEIRSNTFSGRYSYLDYVEFTKEQLEFYRLKSLTFYVDESNRESAAMEWVYLISDLYISQEKEIIINGSRYNMGVVKQKLLLLDFILMLGIFQNFEKLKGQKSIKNPRSYMIASLINAHSASGVTANSIEEKLF